MPAPHRSDFTGRMPFLTPNQQRQSTEGTDPNAFQWICWTHLACIRWGPRSSMGRGNLGEISCPMPMLFNGQEIYPKLSLLLGGSGPPYMVTWTHPICQTASWSVQPFLHDTSTFRTHRHTPRHTSVAIGSIYMLCIYDLYAMHIRCGLIITDMSYSKYLL